ncbi:MAG: hypothetical protein R6X20_01365 [Phycisphaerae bacterium]
MIRRTIAVALLFALAPAGARAAAPDDEAQAAFKEAFGDDLAKVQATVETADDVALAERMLKKARSGTAGDALEALLCERAYDLAVGEEGGFSVAVDAMERLMRLHPDRREAAREKILNAHQQRYNNARGRDRIEAGEALVRTLVDYADERVAMQQFPEAARLYRRALPLAKNLLSISHDHLKAKLDYAQTRQGFLAQAERLKAHLEEHPDDQDVREKLVRIYVVEFDDPEAAAKQLNLAQDDPLNKYILLAGMTTDKLPVRALAALGHRYRQLAAEASRQGRILAMHRARTYYQAYLKRVGADAGGSAGTDPGTGDKADPAELTAVRKGLVETNDALAEVAAAFPIITVVTHETFEKEWADRFPRRDDVGAHGSAEASSSWGTRRPQDVFGGDRTGTAWSLDNPRGWFYATWKPPAHGRYVLIFPRGGEPGTNPWGRAELNLNETKSQRLADVASGKVVIVDLGLNVPVKSLRVMIQGKTYPGLACIEVHPEKPGQMGGEL